MATSASEAPQDTDNSGLSPHATPFTMPLSAYGGSSDDSGFEQIMASNHTLPAARVVILVGCPGSGKSKLTSLPSVSSCFFNNGVLNVINVPSWKTLYNATAAQATYMCFVNAAEVGNSSITLFSFPPSFLLFPLSPVLFCPS